MAASASDTRGPPSTLFLPDFCESRAVLAVVLIVELVALMFAISRHALHASFWLDLASSSLFLLWIGLTCAGVLCRARAWLHTLPATQASLIAIALMLACVGVISELVYQIGRFWSSGLPDLDSVFPTEHAGFLLRSLGVGFIVSALALRYFYVSAEWKRSIEMEALARIRALQARIRPHFLFNSMNTIAELTRSSPERAEQAVEDLADLFRASLSDANARISLQRRDRDRAYARAHRAAAPARPAARALGRGRAADARRGAEPDPAAAAGERRVSRHRDAARTAARCRSSASVSTACCTSKSATRSPRRPATASARAIAWRWRTSASAWSWPGPAAPASRPSRPPGEFCARLIFPADEVNSLPP